jgi:hypothetical protein
MTELTHTVPADTCAQAWVEGVEYLLSQPSHEAYNLTLAIRSPLQMTPNDFRVHDFVDEFLRARDQEPIATVAGTIFPANYYLREGAAGVYEAFPDAFTKLDNHSWGIYAMRMLRKKGKNGTIINPLEILVGKINQHMERMRSAYEVNLAESDDDGFELPIYRAAEDAKRLRPQPCRSHLTFKLYPGNALMLAVMYRSHYYVAKTLGNLFGLAQLQSFVAAETGLQVGPLICHSTHARVDTGQAWILGDIKELVSQCRGALLATVA